MEYINLETEIEIRFHSDYLDMLQIGHLNLQLHRLINQVAAAMLEEEGLLTAESLPINASNELVLVRGIAISIENGSVIEKVRLKVAAVFSRDNLKKWGRDLVINVAANLVIAGVGVAIKPDSPKLPSPPETQVERVAPEINRMVRELSSNGGGRLTYRSYENGKLETEVLVEIPNRE